MEIGIDVGGTKTHVLIAHGDGTEHEVVVPTAQWRIGDLLEDPANAVRLVGLFADAVHTPVATPLVVGAHGCDSEAMRVEFERRLRHAYPGPVRALNDAALLAPAAGLAEAICLIDGTGSVVFGVDAHGEFVITGGYGAILGDPGSAPALVREAIKAVLFARDEGQEPDALAIALMQHYATDDLPALALSFSSDFSLTRWGGAASLVFAAVEDGSSIAAHVIDAAAAELALSVHHARQLGALGGTVVAAGGVITNQVLMRDRLRHHLALVEPTLDLLVLTTPPVRGAVALAKKLPHNNRNTVQGGMNATHSQAV